MGRWKTKAASTPFRTFAGNGSLTGSVSVANPSSNGGIFIVGDTTRKAGLASISDNYTQLATGTTDVQIGGTTARTQYSQVDATGPVVLGGTLNIARINKFSPATGQTFTIVSSPSGVTGTFATVNGTTISATKKFVISYDSNAVLLTAQ